MQVGGLNALPLCELEQWVGNLALEGIRIGLSVLLSPGDSAHVEEFLERAYSVGIRRFRFIPLEPDGRASLVPTAQWSEWPAELNGILSTLLRARRTTELQLLTLNDPFDLRHSVTHAGDSCLLHSRRLPSVAPNGDIYSCCFNVFRQAHKIGNILAPEAMDFTKGPFRLSELPCRALEPLYWKDARPQRVTCPISSISLVSCSSANDDHQILTRPLQ